MLRKIGLNLLVRKTKRYAAHLPWMTSAIVLLMMLGNLTYAIDNPDTQDLIATFEAKERPILAKTEKPDNGYRTNLLAYTDYLEFLDRELNTVYRILHAKLPKDKQDRLKQSQIVWLKYRDAEFSFIEETWTKENFGSSSSVTRGQYKAAIVRDRVIQLMQYTRSL